MCYALARHLHRPNVAGRCSLPRRKRRPFFGAAVDTGAAGMAEQVALIDAFTATPFAGNAATSCLSERPRDAAWMQRVARAFQPRRRRRSPPRRRSVTTSTGSLRPSNSPCAGMAPSPAPTSAGKRASSGSPTPCASVRRRANAPVAARASEWCWISRRDRPCRSHPRPRACWRRWARAPSPWRAIGWTNWSGWPTRRRFAPCGQTSRGCRRSRRAA